MKNVTQQMTGFIDYFLDNRTTRSIKRNFLGNLWRNMSCSGSRERKAPLAYKILNGNQSNTSKISVQPAKNYINKFAARRNITLQSKERPINSARSEKHVTTVTKPTTKKRRKYPHSKRLEINMNTNSNIKSERNNSYSAAVSTQEKQFQMRI
jgi:hypothetical protein